MLWACSNQNRLPRKNVQFKLARSTGICMDDCRISSTHAVPSRRAPMPQGVYIGPKTDKHAYCFPCLTTYIQTKLVDSTASKVFPINCPEVSPGQETTCASLTMDVLSARRSRLQTSSRARFLLLTTWSPGYATSSLPTSAVLMHFL
jgi:hypothetical protein